MLESGRQKLYGTRSISMIYHIKMTNRQVIDTNQNTEIAFEHSHDTNMEVEFSDISNVLRDLVDDLQSDSTPNMSDSSGRQKERKRRPRNRFKRGTQNCRMAEQTSSASSMEDSAKAGRIDMFKPLYKRDKKLTDPTQCEEILDSRRLVSKYLESNQVQNKGVFKVAGYTVRVTPYPGIPKHEKDTVGGATIQESLDEYIRVMSDRRDLRMLHQDPACDSLEPQYHQLTVDELPGLVIIPSLIPSTVQAYLVDEIVEDLVPDLQHRNNLDIHYEMGDGLILFPEFPNEKENNASKNVMLQPRERPIYMGKPFISRDKRLVGGPRDTVSATSRESTSEASLPNSVNGSNLSLHSADSSQASVTKPEPDQYSVAGTTTHVTEPLSIYAVRTKKLRWITLGGQYNWTTKEYPSFAPGSPGFPYFPQAMSLIFSRPVFDLAPEAAIINFYSPGDTLSPHQDVAEISDQDLASVSIGCDAVFYVGLDRYREQGQDEQQVGSGGRVVQPPLQVLLHSGDAIVMGGSSRYAYHGVGRVWPNTCPQFLADVSQLPFGIRSTQHLGNKQVEVWRKKWDLYTEWMQNKRININVRQMLPV